MIRSTVLSLLLLFSPVLTGCASLSPGPSPEVRQILAPTGSLRVAVYTGTPTSVLSDTDRRGVGYDLGEAFAHRLNVPFKPTVFSKNADVLAAVKSGAADVAFTNASADRAKDMDFTQVYLNIELGYLTSPKATIAAMSDVDRPGVRVGVTTGSSSDAVLSHDLKNATVVRITTFDQGVAMLTAGTVDVYATNKATLFEMQDRLPGSRILAGSWGLEQHAMAIPKGRMGGMAYARAFIADALTSGRVKAAIARAGLRGGAAAS